MRIRLDITCPVTPAFGIVPLDPSQDFSGFLARGADVPV